MTAPGAPEPPPADARGLLLDKVVAHLSADGSQDLTLRGLAAGARTSHRMLLYHFGSLDGLIAAVVAEVEQRQRDALGDLAADPSAGLADIAEALWLRLRAPDLRPLERLFFELYARGLAKRPDMVTESAVLPWLEAAEALLVARGQPEPQARAFARLGQAVTRGLLLDLLATGDEDAVDRAMALYLSLLADLDRRKRAGG